MNSFIRLIKKNNKNIYNIISERYSYFKLDFNGDLEYVNDLPIRCEGTYLIPTTIVTKKTAIIVMDPWINTASEHLDNYFKQIIINWLIPLVHRAQSIGHPIVILTNDPSKITCWEAAIDPTLQQMVNHKEVNLLYHQDFTEQTFANWLRSKNIDTLIYTGFASNQCIIGRPMGMITMRLQQFRCFFIPETSAAIEMPETWESKHIHNATSFTISQWIGNLIHWQDYMDATESIQ